VTAGKHNITYRRQAAQGTLTLRGRVDIFESEALHAQALRALQDTKATTLQVESTHAEIIDFSALQILCALKRDVEAEGRSCIFQAIPEEIRTRAEQYGFLF
jgi:anti-anti-sigma regulatory factor